MENPIKIDDFGVPLFLETPIYIYKSPPLKRQEKKTSTGPRYIGSAT